MGEWLLADRSFFLKSTKLFLFLTYIKLIALLAVCLSLCTLMACEISSGKDTNEEQKTEVPDKVSGGKISRDEHKHVYARATCEEYENYKITTGIVDFSIDVSGGSSLKIVFTNNNGGETYSSALVNAQLYK